MKMTHFVHRYGAEIGGGAEGACRMMAEHLAARGHEITVVTTCAIDYHTWADAYDPGTSVINGVEVVRHRVDHARDMTAWTAFATSVLRQRHSIPLDQQREFVARQGPAIASYADVVDRHAGLTDIAIFHTYLYQTTTAGLARARRICPTVLHPTAHHEDAFQLPIFDQVLRQADGYFFHTPEEANLVAARLGGQPTTSAIIGLGTPEPARVSDDQKTQFRTKFGLGDTPFFLVLGRVDPAKGVLEIVESFTGLKRIFPFDARLVVVGEQPQEYPIDSDVVVTGFVSETEKNAALAAATALVVPSYAESFSLVLLEAWAHGTPAIVQGACEVLAGQARRSGGAVTYTSARDLYALINRALTDQTWVNNLGNTGQRYGQTHYDWTSVIDQYEDLAARTIASRRRLNHR